MKYLNTFYDKIYYMSQISEIVVYFFTYFFLHFLKQPFGMPLNKNRILQISWLLSEQDLCCICQRYRKEHFKKKRKIL